MVSTDNFRDIFAILILIVVLVLILYNKKVSRRKRETDGNDDSYRI